MAELVGRIAQILEKNSTETGRGGEVPLDVKVTVRGLLLELIEMVLDSNKSAKNGLSIVLQLLSIATSQFDWVVGDSTAVLLHIADRFGLILLRCNGKSVVEEAAAFIVKILETIHREDRLSFERCVSMVTGPLLMGVCDIATSMNEKGLNIGELDLGKCCVTAASPSSLVNKTSPDRVSVDGKGCENIIAGAIMSCSKLAKVIPMSICTICREKTMFPWILNLLMSQSLLIQDACLDFVEVYMRSPMVSDEDCRAVLVQCSNLTQSSFSESMDLTERVYLNSKLVGLLWTLWDTLEYVSHDFNGIEILNIVEQALVACPVDNYEVRKLWLELYCDCVCAAPDVGIQFSAVYRNLNSFPLGLQKRLLAAADVLMSQYPKEDVCLYVSSLKPVVYRSIMDPLNIEGSHKKQKLSHSPRKKELLPSQNPSSQFSSPSLGRLVKGILISYYHILNEHVLKQGEGVGKVAETLDKLLFLTVFIAQLDRDMAFELVTELFDQISSSKISAKIFHHFCLQIKAAMFDVCVSQSLPIVDTHLDRYTHEIQNSAQRTLLDLLVLDNDQRVGIDSASLQITAKDIEFAHFLPLVLLNKEPKRSRETGKKSRGKSVYHNVPDLIIGCAEVSEELEKRFLVGLIIFLAKWPDMSGIFAIAREALLVENELFEYIGVEGLGSLQPRDSTIISKVLDSLWSKYKDSEEIGAMLMQATAMAFHRASATDSEEWRRLARYLIQAVQFDGKQSRALVSNISVLKCENFVLALSLKKEHPINSRDRSSASIQGENEVVRALQSQLPNSVEKAYIFQNVLLALAYCSSSMSNVNAVNLSLVVLIAHLESKDLVINALAAQCLVAISELKGVSLKDMILQNQPLLEILGPRLPSRTDMLVELADLLEISTKALLSASMSTILPTICDKGGIKEIKALSNQLGVETKHVLYRYGEYPLTAAFMKGKPTLQKFLELARSALDGDFENFVTSITPRTLNELILQTGADKSWNSCQGSLPDALVESTSKSISILMGQLGNLETDPVHDISSVLAEGDNVTRLLKHLGDKFDDKTSQGYLVQSDSLYAPLKIIRGVIFLIRVTGQYVGRHLPQFLVLLSASIRRTAPVEVKVQGLIGLTYLIRALASYAPLQLGSSSNQIAVFLLESLQADGSVGTAAFKALETLVDACKKMFPEKLKALPPIPQCSKDLKKLGESLIADGTHCSVTDKVRSLLEGLQGESLDVRAVTLVELRNILRSQRQWAGTLTNPFRTSEDESLLRDLISALIKSCSPEITSLSSITAQQVCAECLGILGALDPSRVRLNTNFEPSRYQGLLDLAHDVIINHLIKLLMTANSMSVLDRITVAIQDILKCDFFIKDAKKLSRRKSKGTHSRDRTLFDTLPEDTQAVVKPYLDSRYSFGTFEVESDGVIYTSKMRFRVWLGRWLVKMINNSGDAPEVSLFRALVPVILFDVPTAMKIAPYIIVRYLEHSKVEAKNDIAAEILHVIEENTLPSSDGLSCIQAIFSLLDVLSLWQEENQANSQTSTDFDWRLLQDMFVDIPRVKLANAASKCGAHARALLYYETHLRLTRGNGANIAAFSTSILSDEEVSNLLGIYSKLEEPDGLDGIMKLRQGTSKLEDQRLAAEKNGSWTEACSLYELDISRAENGKDSKLDLMDGYLNCLLQMGHWEGLANQVKGLLSSKDGGFQTAKVLSKGAGALWRLGKFDKEMEYYVNFSDAKMENISLDEMWELKLARVLFNLSKISSGNGSDDLNNIVSKELSSMRHDIVPHFSAAAKESYARAYPYLVKLHMIQEIADATEAIENHSIGPKERQRLLKWSERFSLTRPTLTTRGPILDLRRQLGSLMKAEEEVGTCWIEHARLCRETGNIDAAIPSAVEARTLGVPGSSLEQLEILYAKGNTHRALQELKGLLPLIKNDKATFEEFSSKKEKIDIVSQMLLKEAQWTAEMGQGTREEVMNLFDQALSIRNWESGFFRYALYLDQYMLDAKDRQANLEKRGEKVFDRLGGKSRVKLNQDRPFYSYYPEVMETYGKCVLSGTENIYQTLPRLLTLWFELGSDAYNSPPDSSVGQVQEKVMSVMKNLSKKIPMPCWMTALPQLISRICHNSPDVAELVRKIITDAAIMYPQQVLWALTGVSKSGRVNRRNAATSIINGAKRRSNEHNKRLFAENNVLCEQLYKLCHFSPPDGAKVISAKKSFSHLFRIMPLGVIMPTLDSLTVFQMMDLHKEGDISGINDGLVTIAGIQDEIHIMTSLMKPKRIVFIGSDGRDYPFLAKPKDDLRKDNRMMEAAGVINKLFKDDPDARQRDLYLRRFAVIAITEDCGLVEWVTSTRPVRSCISEVFVDTPSQLKLINQEVKKLYDNAANGHVGHSKAVNLIKWLEAVLATYPPCFHRWFLKHYPEPASWLNARLSFTRTYSAWCVVGHVVGLGDRHLENVLIDMSNGDAIQIDFGCLFDKGLTLPQPEVVPFRLTQNVIDAFGVSGVEGVYRHSFENTLSILRKHRGNILSIMDTFVHDPLVDWAKSEEKRGSSRADKEADNPQARDWLDTISGRLQGTLLGVTSEPCMPLSVQGQAQRLIQEATSIENLSRMYIWWQAWY